MRFDMSVCGGMILVKALSKFGVNRIFSLPGHQILAVYDACINEGIEVISTRHEACAVYMAEATSFATRDVGVVLLAGGPELTNAITGIARAYYACTPLLIISGVNTPEKLDRGFPQDMNQLELVRPLTKWARACYDATRIPEYLASAYKQALRGRPGPVYLEIPYNILEGNVTATIDYLPKPERICADGALNAMEDARELLAHAERPIVIAGSGVVWSKADDTLTKFIQETQLPLFLAPTGLPVKIPADVVTGYGTPGAGVFSMDAIANADVILFLGVRINFALGLGQEPFMSDDQQIIQVDIEGEELGNIREVDIPICGDVNQVLSFWLEKGITNPHLLSWNEKLKRESNKYEQDLARLKSSDQIPIHPLRLVDAIERSRGDRSNLVLDGANSVLWNFLTIKLRAEGQILISPAGSLEAIGAGIPHALAMKLAFPKHDVFLHIGDGTFGYHIMEYETALRYGIPFVAIVHNDSAWGMTRDMQSEFFGQGREIGNELLNIRYDLLVREMGGYGEYVTEPAEIEGAIQRALYSELPACVNVAIDPEPRSPGLEMFFLLEIMLGHHTFYDRIPKIVDRAGRIGLDRLTSGLMRWYLAQEFQRKIK